MVLVETLLFERETLRSADDARLHGRCWGIMQTADGSAGRRMGDIFKKDGALLVVVLYLIVTLDLFSQ